MAGVKEGEIYVALPDGSQAGWGLEGVFFRDTCYFDRWSWQIEDLQPLSRAVLGSRLTELYCQPAADRAQAVEFRRELVVSESGITDQWTARNYAAQPRTVELRLCPSARMVDLFALRSATGEAASVETTVTGSARVYSRHATDGIVHTATVRASETETGGDLPADLFWSLTLSPGETQTVGVAVDIAASDAPAPVGPPLPTLADWKRSFGALCDQEPAVVQAIADLRTLLLRTEHGPYPAAGLPVFVNFFGRDALITGMMILDWRPDVLRAVLAFLAARQGTAVDPFREEEPGKILHEVRRGELSRSNTIPFGRYYGSVDSTPLFLVAAGAYLAAQPEPAFAAELRPTIEAATAWLLERLDGASGLATFSASGSGLTVQSWKDSANSMVDEHGQPARQPLAVAEVQGYAHAALLAVAELLPERRDALRARAATLADAFHRQFWLEDMATYAMALDADMKPLRVQSSDPGHLLWSGIVPAAVAPRLVATLMGSATWSGWGLRTLGSAEQAYNPVSYHNGSVWPHDTGLFAMGLARYGFTDELKQVARALLDLAAASPNRQMPELISGYARTEYSQPVPYTHANVPQAWSAATVVRMAAYLMDQRSQA
jgi:glycogen debranching enzyme